MHYSKHVDRNDMAVNIIKNIASITTGFASVSNIPRGAKKLMMSTDGVGTKIKLAYEYNDYSGIGQDLVAMCVNDIIAEGGIPKYFHDYIGVNKIRNYDIEYIIDSIHKACVANGIQLTGGETAELESTYANDYPELVGFAVGFLQNNLSAISPGDLLLGMSSSGVHSNGFTLIRSLLGPSAYIPELLTPTHIYTNVADIYINYPNIIKRASHITGGGLESNISRAIPYHKFELDYSYLNMKIPEIFKLLKSIGNLELDDMYKVFNMGIGMVLIVSKNNYKFLREKMDQPLPVIGKVL